VVVLEVEWSELHRIGRDGMPVASTHIIQVEFR